MIHFGNPDVELIEVSLQSTHTPYRLHGSKEPVFVRGLEFDDFFALRRRPRSITELESAACSHAPYDAHYALPVSNGNGRVAFQYFGKDSKRAAQFSNERSANL